uniref:Uncharacterized protein n=1 Tax=Anguilla anguilla TaxID=7936 RepID=A0A0E9QMG5_ANGAN
MILCAHTVCSSHWPIHLLCLATSVKLGSK